MNASTTPAPSPLLLSVREAAKCCPFQNGRCFRSRSRTARFPSCESPAAASVTRCRTCNGSSTNSGAVDSLLIPQREERPTRDGDRSLLLSEMLQWQILSGCTRKTYPKN